VQTICTPFRFNFKTPQNLPPSLKGVGFKSSPRLVIIKKCGADNWMWREEDEVEIIWCVAGPDLAVGTYVP